ncbi:MAG: hypothetical protein QOH25_3114 [Acidobacteriota bacterium]|jgi:hypothetical protein|nr:hypothetical protein [Acidobacteriota bacterium]
MFSLDSPFIEQLIQPERNELAFHRELGCYSEILPARLDRVLYANIIGIGEWMKKLQKIFKFLKSLWGALTTAAILFPGAAALLKVPIAVENSHIASLYPIVATIVSAFGLLLMIAYLDTLANVAKARKTSVIAMSIALLSFFGYVAVRVYLLDVEYVRMYKDPVEKTQTAYARRRGEVIISTRSLNQIADGNLPEATDITSGDPWDLLGLMLFSGTFASFSVAFGALGLHVYEKHSGRRGI